MSKVTEAAPVAPLLGRGELLSMIGERTTEIAYLCDYASQGAGDTKRYLLCWAKHHAVEASGFAHSALGGDEKAPSPEKAEAL